MILFYIILITFLILWEIIYIVQRKYHKLGLGMFDDYYGEQSWLEYKFNSLMVLILIICLTAIIGLMIYGLYTAGVIIQTTIFVGAIIIFFGINYIFRVRKKDDGLY